MFGICCRPAASPAPSKRASDLDSVGLRQSPAEVPPLDIEMLRSKSEPRILQPAVSLKDGVGGAPNSCSSARSLWEASAYRVASHELSPGGVVGEPDSEDQGIPQRFIEAYVAALRDSNPRWATAPEVAGLFADSAKMKGQDGSVTMGKAAVLRRLEQNTEMMIKMAGKDGAVPDWDVSAPRFTEAQSHEMRCTIRRGSLKLTFALEFVLVSGKIHHLSNTRQ